MLRSCLSNTARCLRFGAVILTALAGTAHAAPFAYITNEGTSTVTVIDTATNTVVTTVAVGDSPFGVTVNPAGTRAYVANQGDSTISVIDLATNTVIATPAVGANPLGVAVNPGGTRFYVVNSGEDDVSVMDAGTNKLIGTVEVGSDPQGIAVNPNGARAYVANQADSTVSVIDILADTVVAVVPVGTNPFGVAVNPAGTRAYVTNQEDGTVSVIDTSANSVIATVPVGGNPFGVAVNPAGTLAYVANENDDTVSVINTSSNSAVATVPVGMGPYGLAVDPAGTHVYVANVFTNNVSVISTGTSTVVATVPVGSNPIAFGLFIGGNASSPSSTITNGPPPNGTVGTAYTFTYTFTGSPTFSVTSGRLPPGLTLTAAGVISGTPTTAGTFTGVVTASEGTGPDDTQAFSITIASSVPHAPTITNGPPPGGTVGIAYNFPYTSTGSPLFSVKSGSLPAGLSLTTDGVISGTPTAAGISTGVVMASNGTAPDATQNFSITIAAPTPPPPPTITNGPPPGGTVGTAYTFAYTSTASPVFSVKTGGLPPGLALSAAGLISGTPSTAGNFTGTVNASNGTAPDANQNFSITILPPTHPSITNGPPPDGTVGIAYSFTYTSTGGPTFSISSGSLPPGLTLSVSGVISGTPTAAGGSTGIVTATNGIAPAATQNFTITISVPIPPTITDGPPPNGSVGLAYTFTYTASRAPTFSLTSGALPTGLTLTSAGVISGTPTTTGTFTGTVTASNGVAPDATQSFSITISAPIPPTITNGPPPDGVLDAAYAFTYTSTASPVFSVTSGSLPPGLSLSALGVISGTPTSVGIFTGTVTAGNGAMPDATQDFSITIAPPPPPTITNGPPHDGEVGVTYFFAYTSTGSPGFSLTTGTLPTGLMLSSTGVISGTPTTAGTFTGTVTAINGTAPDFPQPFSIVITVPVPGPTITNGPPPPNGTLGVGYSFTFNSTGSPSFSVTSGGLPPGLTLSASGVISGTPTATGTFAGTITAGNGIAPDATQDFSISIVPSGSRHRSVRPTG